MFKKLLLIASSMLISMGLAFAQSNLSGKVIGAEDGQPVIGATVQIVGTSIGVTTDMNGAFHLSKVPSKAVVRVSCIGMKTQEVKAADAAVIRLEIDAEALDALIFTGYGTVSRTAFTGTAAKVDGDALEKKSDANFVKNLEGTVTGVQMAVSTSMPGSWGSVLVRGRGSLNSGTQPLYVVDGIPVESGADSMFDTDAATDPMSAINPNDIESVTVLKDAAATAIYGSRASNGVIVVTTKSGNRSNGNVTLSVKHGVSTVSNNNMILADAASTMNLFANGYAARTGRDFDTCYAYLKDTAFGWDGESSYNWLDHVTRKGIYQDYNLSASGRVGSTNYYVSGGYFRNEGVVMASDFERFSGRVNLNSKFKMFTLGLNASFASSTKNGFSQSTAGAMNSVVTGAISSMMPFDPFYDENGEYNPTPYNPEAVWDSELGDISIQKNTTLNIAPSLQVDFAHGIYAKSTLGVNLLNLDQYEYWSAIYNPQGADYNGLGMNYKSTSSTITWNNILGWKYNFAAKHDVSVLLGQEIVMKDYSNDYMEGDDFPFASAGMRDLSTVGHWGDSEHSQSEANLSSFFVDAHYAYDYKYFLSASFRRDGSSVFGADRRWGNFWSVGGKWNFTKEDFLANDILTNGNLKVSYGTVGNQDIGWYAARGFYVSGANYAGAPGMQPGSISNPELTWEVSKKFDIGADLTFFNRLNVNVDFYNELTDSALYDVPLSLTTGMSSATKNIGMIRNRGVELSFDGVIYQNRDFVWSAYANATFNRNKVIKLNGDPIEGTYTMIEEGHPYRQWYMVEYAGVDRETGKPQFYLNADDDELTNDWTACEKRYLGSADPKVFGGFGTSVSWKGFDASISFNYRYGSKLFDYGAMFTGWGMSFMTPLQDVADNSWTAENPDAKYPQYIYGDPYQASSGEHSRFLMDGSYLRLSNIVVGYTLPEKWTKKARIEKVRIYFSGDNLHTFTAKNFTGFSPDTYESGIIAWQYPGASNYIGGIQITF